MSLAAAGGSSNADPRAERSNRDLEQFAYIASHDLQEPLRMVSNYTTLLAEELGDSLDDTVRRHLDFAHDGALRMQQLVSDLLQFSRVGREPRRAQSMSTAIGSSSGSK